MVILGDKLAEEFMREGWEARLNGERYPEGRVACKWYFFGWRMATAAIKARIFEYKDELTQLGGYHEELESF